MAAEQETTEIIDDPIEVRRNKRQAIIDAGGTAYAVRFDVSDHCADIEERYAEFAKEASHA